MARKNLNHVLEEVGTDSDFVMTGKLNVEGNGGVGNVTAGTPTAAELTATFGAPSEVGKGFIAYNDDNDADTSVQLVVSNGKSWFFSAALTKAS